MESYFEWASEEENEYFRKLSGTFSSNDEVTIDKATHETIKGMWVRNTANDADSEFTLVPSDILVADTIPLKTVKFSFEAWCCEGGYFDCEVSVKNADFVSTERCRAAPACGNFLFITFRKIWGQSDLNATAFAYNGENFLTVGHVGYSDGDGLKESIKNVLKDGGAIDDFEFTARKVINEALSYWYSIQIALLNPTLKAVFSNPRVERVVDHKRLKNGKQGKRVVRYVRHFIVNEDALAAIKGEREKRKYSCKAWYVIGHWRTYRDGRKVFIQPYWKGELRYLKSASESRERKIVIKD